MRKISTTEITALESRGCSCADWERVTVSDRFNPLRYHNVALSGDIELGEAEGTFELEGGVTFRAGISNARLHNVKVGKDVYIAAISNYIANYDIADGAFIENANRIVTRPGATFGIGTEVSVLNETGGREVPLYERLNAQTAYMIAMYRHSRHLTERLNEIVAAHVETVRSDRGRIGHNARIVNTGVIEDVNVGDYATIEGATNLSNGTISSSEAAPVKVGDNVMADSFVLAAGANVEGGVVLRHVFVGQASSLSHLFSAHDSLFFSNCACENGEACAIFAGPYTVTMHKSSLLIAGMFSFLNAGSGSNQSNHMYKLGPIHQGVVERGSKTTSDSYILWPARVGAFSLVMGRHVGHPDTSPLPFSYLIENKGRTFLVPGVNLKSVGTIRDTMKWPKRDRRRDPDRLDCINFNLLSPYTVKRMIDGCDLLTSIENISGRTAERYTFQSMTIEARALRKGCQYYNMAIDKFMGNSLIKRLEGVDCLTDEAIAKRLQPTHHAGSGEWVDIAGLIAPKNEVTRLCNDIIEHRVNTLEEIEHRFHTMHSDYYDMEWTWVAENFERWSGVKIEDATRDTVRSLVERWRKSVIDLDKLLYEDAAKEYSLTSSTGFGVDGSENRRKKDFAQVRGEFESDPFVTMVLRHIDTKTHLADDIIRRLHCEQ